MPRALLFVNAKASQTAECLQEITEHLEKGGLTVENAEPTSADDYGRCLDVRRGEYDLVVVAGGDGTVRCAANAILAAEDPKPPLGIIPLGTANNVARSLGIPINVAGACAIIAGGHAQDVDLGRVNGRLFVSVVGMGLSTQVHAQTPAELKRRWGWMGYAYQGIKLLIKRPPSFRATIKYDGKIMHVRALQITACNGRYYGARVEIHPEATLNDGMLDLSVIEAGKYLRGFLKALLPLRTGHRSPGLRLIQAKAFEITSSPVMQIDAEGDTDLQTPAKFEVLPKAIRVFSPKKD